MNLFMPCISPHTTEALILAFYLEQAPILGHPLLPLAACPPATLAEDDAGNTHGKRQTSGFALEVWEKHSVWTAYVLSHRNSRQSASGKSSCSPSAEQWLTAIRQSGWALPPSSLSQKGWCSCREQDTDFNDNILLGGNGQSLWGKCPAGCLTDNIVRELRHLQPRLTRRLHSILLPCLLAWCASSANSVTAPSGFQEHYTRKERRDKSRMDQLQFYLDRT